MFLAASMRDDLDSVDMTESCSSLAQSSSPSDEENRTNVYNKRKNSSNSTSPKKKAKKASTTTAAGGKDDAFPNIQGSEQSALMQQNDAVMQPPIMYLIDPETGEQLHNTMYHYQVQGLRWLNGLYLNNINGILADEMGLGKTIQVISFFAHCHCQGAYGPRLVVAPLSTLGNWEREFSRWIPGGEYTAIIYHGTQQEREAIRNKHMKRRQQNKPHFPAVITSYEIAIRDKVYLKQYQWKYIVVDEGHRLKNMQSRLHQVCLLFVAFSLLLLRSHHYNRTCANTPPTTACSSPAPRSRTN